MVKIYHELGEHHNHRIVVGDVLGQWYPKGMPAFFLNGSETLVSFPFPKSRKTKVYKLVEVSETELHETKE